MKRHVSNEVKCPFYRSEDSFRVCCEGQDDHSSYHVVFRSSADKSKYSSRYCCKDYGKCGICQTLYRKYGGSE